LTKSSIQKTEHLAKPTVIDRVEAVRNHLTWAMDWKGERLGIVETRITPIISKEFILLKPTSKN
jgi:hypothetical protein